MAVRNNQRIIIHLDYDCFYASVFEVEQPALKSLPLAVQQKQIVVTCNYTARRQGLHKLQLISDAKRICPDVVIVLGEDLTKFRDASKYLFLFVRSFIWGARVEKLGFDELFLDVTEMIEYNVGLLNAHDLATSFFHLDRKDPTVGFAYDATTFQGSTQPAGGKLGNLHKPNSQTTLLPSSITTENGAASNVLEFLDAHEIQKIPGIGSRLAQKLRAQVVGPDTVDEKVTVRDVRQYPGMGPALLEKALGGPGSAKGIGMRIWNILHGVDNTDVLEGRDVPTQISIEDSYTRLETLESVRRELVILSRSLIRRMRTDLLEKNDGNAAHGRWIAHPRTLRLSTRPRPPPGSETARVYSANRISRSVPLPLFIFNLDENLDALAERLVRDSLLSMFRKLHPEKSGWNLSLLNIAVINMVESAGDQKQSSGRDIGKMFRQQETVLQDWTVREPSPHRSTGMALEDNPEMGDSLWEEGEEDDLGLSVVDCVVCGASIPHFAQLAHAMYHAADSEYENG
ncbi:hypothetical protein NUU61_003923 [Penicillium alfredii]|uniref:UmuC domain-containing protein n=1 Tax=Penicillium alfredii TaxID=1506179 RepID=A0A9W9KDB5_9EURO|nr:uncharacterized protein NUU61_003923 [Penicillium alfredii]KAJ5101701.1 hypothetical protein NUU61_003923 [Penicillium alfredii]